MGNIESTCVYNKEYDLVGFIGKNKIGDTIDVVITIEPLYDDFFIPNEKIEKINDYNTSK